MKTKFAALSVITLFFLSFCTKKEEIFFNDTTKLIGKWTLVAYSGGFYNVRRSAPQDPKYTIEFTNQGKYIECKNDTVQAQYNYTLIEHPLYTYPDCILELDTVYTWTITLYADEISIMKGADLAFIYKKQ